MKLSAKQHQMLRDFSNDNEATDLADFDGPGGWHNRESVIAALIRKGFLNDDPTITPEGAEFLRLNP